MKIAITLSEEAIALLDDRSFRDGVTRSETIEKLIGAALGSGYIDTKVVRYDRSDVLPIAEPHADEVPSIAPTSSSSSFGVAVMPVPEYGSLSSAIMDNQIIGRHAGAKPFRCKLWNGDILVAEEVVHLGVDRDGEASMWAAGKAEKLDPSGDLTFDLEINEEKEV